MLNYSLIKKILYFGLITILIFLNISCSNKTLEQNKNFVIVNEILSDITIQEDKNQIRRIKISLKELKGNKEHIIQHIINNKNGKMPEIGNIYELKEDMLNSEIMGYKIIPLESKISYKDLFLYLIMFLITIILYGFKGILFSVYSGGVFFLLFTFYKYGYNFYILSYCLIFIGLFFLINLNKKYNKILIPLIAYFVTSNLLLFLFINNEKFDLNFIFNKNSFILLNALFSCLTFISVYLLSKEYCRVNKKKLPLDSSNLLKKFFPINFMAFVFQTAIISFIFLINENIRIENNIVVNFDSLMIYLKLIFIYGISLIIGLVYINISTIKEIKLISSRTK